MKIRIGTRGSKLAIAQTEMTAKAIKYRFSDSKIEIVRIATHGDKVLDKPLTLIGGKGVFIAEIESALTDGEIDIAVHSAKDLPTELADGTEIGAVLGRGDPRDMLIARKGSGITEPRGKNEKIVIGTGSMRRRIQFGKLYKNAEFKDIRGNVDTRLRKLADGEYDAVTLAAAGLERLGLLGDERFEYHRFPTEAILPAPCQGIIAVQCKSGSAAAEYLKEINDAEVFKCFETEREVIRLLNAGCTMPVGAYAQIEGGKIRLTATKDSVHIVSDCSEIGERFELAKRLVNML